MNATYSDSARGRSDRDPAAVYYGYCGRTNRYRMMDLPDYLSNMQQGVSKWVSDASALYQDAAARGYAGPAGRGLGRSRHAGTDCGCGCGGGCGCGSACDDGHCECRVCDADVLVHARCGEVRRIPVTFENDTRRERAVTLTLDSFKTAGGRDLKWAAQLSETTFTLRGCDEHTVTVAVQVRCDTPDTAPTPVDPTNPSVGGAPPAGTAVNTPRVGSVEHCEVAYATLRADGCLIRPVVLAVAVLPDDCDAYRRPCGCGCCH